MANRDERSNSVTRQEKQKKGGENEKRVGKIG